MSNNNQNQAMQRFFEFVFNVPGDCFCCTWSISCFLETVEHMEGDKRWRSICTLGMSLLSIVIVFLLTMALCPKFYWSEINQIAMFNSTTMTPHINYSSSTYIPTIINTDEHILLQSPINDMDDHTDDIPYNLTIHHVNYTHIGLHLNLWHIKYCNKVYINDTYYKTYYNYSNNQQLSGKIFINNTNTATNETCEFITYRQSGTTSSTQDLSLWFIIFVIALLLLGSLCIFGTHPLFDKCHTKNSTLRSSIQKILAIAITILCACILNWSSFVFAAVFENQVQKYEAWQEKEAITQSNLGTGMLSVNGAMLLGIILSVIHCGAPIRTDLSNAPAQNENENERNEQEHSGGGADGADGQQLQQEQSSQLSHQQRMLLRHIPGGSSSVNNIAILANPDHWFKSNENGSNKSENVILNVEDKREDNKVDSMKEFEYQNMNVVKNKKSGNEDRIYNTNLSMKRIRKKDKKSKLSDKKMSLLMSSEECNGGNVENGKSFIPSLTPITSVDSANNKNAIE